MVRPAKTLTAAVEDYCAALARMHATGGSTGERSSYGPLANLLNAVGATLKPKVFCVQELADQGAGHATLISGCTAPGRCNAASPGRIRFPSGVWWR